MLITLVTAALYFLVLLPIFRLHYQYGWLKSALFTVAIWYVTTVLTGLLVNRLVG